MKFCLLELEGVPVLRQLQLEEALLRTDERNWCILNTNAPPAIVMGISGKPEQLLHLEKVREDNIPLIKRFSGGGTVYVDENTLFVTLIANQEDVGISPFPHAIMEWSKTLYEPIFPGFSLRENDYVFGEKKFGGNAQYIKKGRWLHHTSFLWDFDPQKMEYLKLPEKRPLYRGVRSHGEFLTPLKGVLPNKDFLFKCLKEKCIEKSMCLEALLARPHRRATHLLY